MDSTETHSFIYLYLSVSLYYLDPSLFANDVSSPRPPGADWSFLKLPKQLTWSH